MNAWLLGLDGVWVYIGLLLLLFGGALGLPIPEDIPLVLGGFLIHQGKTSPEMTFIVCYLGTLMGDLFIYAVGRKLGLSISKRPWFQLRFGEDSLLKAKKSLEKRSLLMIFVARHLFYLRTLTFLSCGAVKMGFWRFLLADGTAALISVPLMLSLGYVFGEHHEMLFAKIGRAKELLILGGLILLIAAIWYLRRKRTKSDAVS